MNVVMQQTPEADRRNKIILTVCLIVAVSISFLAVAFRWNNGVDAQNHAVRVMFAVVNDFLLTHEGRWPRDWAELEAFPSDGNWYDPIDFDLVRQHVVIEFEPDFAEIDQQTPTEFQAVRPVNPVFDFGKDPRLIELLRTIHQYHAPPANETSQLPEEAGSS